MEVCLEGGTLPPPSVVPLPFQGRHLDGGGFGVEVRVGLGGGTPPPPDGGPPPLSGEAF